MRNIDEINQVARAIDHAVLNPADGEKELIAGCGTAKKYQTASVCVKPSYVAAAVREMQGSNTVVCTVVGFPHGGTTTAVKLLEAEEALQSGAKEIDMVINIGKLKEGNIDYVKNEIRVLADKVHQNGGILKVIVETALLTDQERKLCCEIIEQAGGDYLKTSTGFASQGAVLEDIKLFKSVLGSRVKIKASGGIKNLEQANEFLQEGCSRLGTSRTEQILSSVQTEGGY